MLQYLWTALHEYGFYFYLCFIILFVRIAKDDKKFLQEFLLIICPWKKPLGWLIAFIQLQKVYNCIVMLVHLCI